MSEQNWTEHQVVISESRDPKTGKVYRQEEKIEGELWRILAVPKAVADAEAASARWDAMLEYLQRRLPQKEWSAIEMAVDDFVLSAKAEATSRLVTAAVALSRERGPLILAAPAPDAEAEHIPASVPVVLPGLSSAPATGARRMMAMIAAAFLAGLGSRAGVRRLVRAAAQLVR